MENPLISIIIPIYNVQNLQRCLDSVKNQTYKNLEILLIDDGSTDDSGKIADEYADKDARFQVFHITNGGVSEARNYGLRKFHGEYLAFIDADDFILDFYIEKLYDAITQCQVKHAICLPCNMKDSDIKHMTIADNSSEKITKINIKEQFDYSKSYSYAYGCVWGSLYHRSLVEDKYFDKNFFVGEDEIFFAQVLSSNDEIAVVNEQLYIYIIYQQSASRGIYDEKKKTNIRAWDRVQQEFINYPTNFQSNLRARCCESYLEALKIMKKSRYQDKEWFDFVLKKARKTLKDFLCSSYSFSQKVSALLYCLSPNIYGKIHKIFR